MELGSNTVETQQHAATVARERNERMARFMDAMWSNNIVPQMIAEQQQAEGQAITA